VSLKSSGPVTQLFRQEEKRDRGLTGRIQEIIQKYAPRELSGNLADRLLSPVLER